MNPDVPGKNKLCNWYANSGRLCFFTPPRIPVTAAEKTAAASWSLIFTIVSAQLHPLFSSTYSMVSFFPYLAYITVFALLSFASHNPSS